MSRALKITIEARVMLLLSRRCLREARCLRIYTRAIEDAVQRVAQDEGHTDLAAMVEILAVQLELLADTLLRRASVETAAPPEVGGAAQEQLFDDQVGLELLSDGQGDGTAAASGPKPRTASGYQPVSRSMEEKLHDARVPIRKLLQEDCVALGLLDAEKAKKLNEGMLGQSCEAGELEAVEFLRESLQRQVKALIRKARGGPWADPRSQEDLRQDIHAARSVRGVLMLRRRITEELEEWERREGKRGGLLGLFASRRRVLGERP